MARCVAGRGACRSPEALEPAMQRASRAPCRNEEDPRSPGPLSPFGRRNEGGPRSLCRFPPLLLLVVQLRRATLQGSQPSEQVQPQHELLLRATSHKSDVRQPLPRRPPSSPRRVYQRAQPPPASTRPHDPPGERAHPVTARVPLLHLPRRRSPPALAPPSPPAPRAPRHHGRHRNSTSRRPPGRRAEREGRLVDPRPRRRGHRRRACRLSCAREDRRRLPRGARQCGRAHPDLRRARGALLALENVGP